MKEIILCKYGEVVLKGANRAVFENMLVSALEKRAARCGSFTVRRAQSTVYVEPIGETASDAAALDAMFEQATKIFGFTLICRAAVCEKNMDSILSTVRDYIVPKLTGTHSFKADARRSDKTFALTSPQIAIAVGDEVAAALPGLRADMRNPESTVMVEIRENAAYVHAERYRGAGGLPPGSSGRGLLLLSGGIDSPVAGYMMAKRGVELMALHFESPPYTSPRARAKVRELAYALTAYTGKIKLHTVSLTRIQEELRKNCAEDYMTLLLRRFMMKLARRCADRNGCGSLITGESMGQVASQTMQAIAVTDEAVNSTVVTDGIRNSMPVDSTDMKLETNHSWMPVLRPCIGMDKEEIIRLARNIGTFDISIQPYEDCCVLFTPRHPKTKPELAKVLAEESKIDAAELIRDAWATLESEVVEY